MSNEDETGIVVIAVIIVLNIRALILEAIIDKKEIKFQSFKTLIIIIESRIRFKIIATIPDENSACVITPA